MPDERADTLTPSGLRWLEIDTMHADVCENGVGMTAAERMFLHIIGGLLTCRCAVSADDEERLRDIAARRM